MSNWLCEHHGFARDPRCSECQKYILLENEQLENLKQIFGDRTMENKISPVTSDPVNHPEHYKAGGIETIDFIEAKNLNYNLGNCVKYISRAGKKDPAKYMQDLMKAAWYLNREIQNLDKRT